MHVKNNNDKKLKSIVRQPYEAIKIVSYDNTFI